jgi:hypothetical protein
MSKRSAAWSSTLTRAQQRQLRELSSRILLAVDPESCPEDRIRALVPLADNADAVS